MTEYEVTISGVFNKKMPPFEFFCQIQVGEKRLRRLWPHQREKNHNNKKENKQTPQKTKKIFTMLHLSRLSLHAAHPPMARVKEDTLFAQGNEHS